MENFIIYPSISVVIVFFLIFISKNIIIEFIKNSIKYDYDEKIENLKAEIKSNESEILALRSGALSSMAERQKLLYSKQVEAIEKIWQSVVGIMPAKTISMMMQNIDYNEWSERAKKDTELQKAFGLIGDNVFKLEDFNKFEISHLQPFLTPILWAYFQAYRTILAHDLTKLSLIKIGQHIPNIDDNSHILKLLYKALPEYSETIEKSKSLSCYNYLEILENKILLEIQNILDGLDVDKQSVQKAYEILKEVKKFKKIIINNQNKEKWRVYR
ncbi:hypothetical protein [Aliarcobacter butzleri]|uniref:hypothetical protein n=1 Tax=Aliarcobacter butzleri TaxID=28197 RepID=UPI003AF7B0DB